MPAAILRSLPLRLRACWHAQKMLPPLNAPRLKAPRAVVRAMMALLISDTDIADVCTMRLRTKGSAPFCAGAGTKQTPSPGLNTAEIAQQACDAQRDIFQAQPSPGWFAGALHSPSANTFNSASSFELSTVGEAAFLT